MNVNIGELKHRVTFWKESNVSDGQGGYVTTWAELAKAWAKVVEQSPRERFYRGENAHTQGMTFTIRQPQTFSLDTQSCDKLNRHTGRNPTHHHPPYIDGVTLDQP